MLPSDWKIEPLERLVRYDTGRTPARANPSFWEGPGDRIPWVAISDMKNFGTVTKTSETITRAAVEKVFRGRSVRAGTLIMSFKLTIGRVTTLGVDACHNEAIISIYPKRGIDQRFLGYFLSQVNYDDHQDRQVKGNTLNRDKINRIPIPLPHLAEQSQIADVLDRARAAITVQQHALNCAQELKRAAMRELFTRGLRGEAQKETEIGFVPESWELVAVGQAVVPLRFDRRKQLQSSSYMEAGKWPIVDQGQAAIAGYTDDADRLIETDAPVIIFGDHTRVFKYIDFKFALGADGTKPLIAVEGIVPKYLFYALCNLEIPSRGYNRHYIVLSGQLLAKPEQGEQHEIVEILDAIDRKIDLHMRKKAVLEELFKTLLHKLMAGEIRVAELELSALTPAEKAEAAA